MQKRETILKHWLRNFKVGSMADQETAGMELSQEYLRLLYDMLEIKYKNSYL